MKSITVILGLTFLFSNDIYGQCCSANPVNGSLNAGEVVKKSLRVIVSHRYGYSDEFFEKDKLSEFNFIENAQFNYLSTVIAYGLLEKLTVEFEGGYYFNKTENFKDIDFVSEGWGFSNSVVSVKTPLLKTESGIEITPGLGLKFPFSRELQIVNNVQLSDNVQPSTGAYGIVAQLFMAKINREKGLNFFIMERFETNYTNIKGYQLGNSLNTSFFISKTLGENWSTVLHLRNEIRGSDIQDNNVKTVTGGYLFFASPQLIYASLKGWYISGGFEIPLYHYFNGATLANKYSLSGLFGMNF